MDFPQQIEETLVERPPTAYDVVMESPLCINMERKAATAAGNIDKMNSSLNSPLDDTTPSDSGVQMLDSELEASELMIDSITSQNGFEFEETKTVGYEKRANFLNSTQIQELQTAKMEQTMEQTPIDTNSNVTTQNATGNCDNEDIMTASACSTFDTTESIVYRRKLRKATTNTAKAPKKRVSFHEDILKNTRTDNIHIEHGFITYKNGRKMPSSAVTGNRGRYSWCSEGQQPGAVAGNRHAELCADTLLDGEEEIGADSSDNGRRRRVVYRNACSDVLDYGNSDIYDTNEPTALQYDNSGIFEYLPRQEAQGAELKNDDACCVPEQTLYRCLCSSSNSSLDSDENDKNSNQQRTKCATYAGGQPKSSSCDCVLASNMSNANNNFITDNCYYSEPNIDNLKDNVFKKSVWNKEKKPKSSCLKKTKNHTNVIHEQDLSTKIKKFNVHDMNNLLDNSSKMLFGSLKSIFTMPLPERGVPEGSEDLHTVAECLTEFEQTPEHKPAAATTKKYIESNTSKNNNENVATPTSPVLKSKPFISKSLDGSKAQQNVKKFVHNVDEQLRRKNIEELFVPSRQTSDETSLTTTEVIKTNETKSPLQRQQEFECQTTNMSGAMTTAPSSSVASPPPSIQFRNKFIINCESTVFEHTGVSYEAQQSLKLNDTIDKSSNQMNDNNIDIEEDDSLVVAVADDEISIGSNAGNLIDKPTPIAQPEPDHVRSAFYAAPIAKTFSSFFRSFKEATTSTPSASAARKLSMESLRKLPTKQLESDESRQWKNYCAPKLTKKTENPLPIASQTNVTKQPLRSTLPTATSSSTISSELSTSTSSSSAHHYKQQQQQKPSTSIGSNSLVLSHDLRSNMEKQSRHLPSPLKKRNSGSNNLMLQPQRYGTQNSYTTNNTGSSATTSQLEHNLLSPDPFNNYNPTRNGSGRDSKSTILSEEFDDILTITTDTDKNESDIVIVDYPSDLNDMPTTSSSSIIMSGAMDSSVNNFDYGNLLKPPSSSTAKTSLINRFLRNVTQKKILESSMRRNNFFAQKLKTEQKLLTGQLYVRGVRGPKNYELIDDLNAEIAMEIEMSGANSPRRELTSIDSSDLPGDVSRFELGIGEISIDIFNGNYLHILRDTSEQLMKVFKLYTGYSHEGFMTPVLVFLTDRTLYVTDLVRNRLCTKFVLAYVDLDVILLGPYGNTVLLSNSTRDMQQVLLAGGPYPADRLVANLELCARRSGSTLPAVGQLTLAHLAPLRSFVREHSSVGKNDAWMYYAVVNVPSVGTLGGNLTSCGASHADQEPLGPHVKGFLMHRRIKNGLIAPTAGVKPNWNPGYFLLKAGVLYMFTDSTQKLPSWAMALAECQGARRALKTGRPHCFEIIMRGGELLQMAAPDEYVASEWLQALLQSASGLFELQEKHKTLGCTLVVTQNHLITLREDFTAPLRKINKSSQALNTTFLNMAHHNMEANLYATSGGDTGSVLSSTKSTPTKTTQLSSSSINSTPTKLSQLSRSTTTSTATSTTTGNTLTSQTASNTNNLNSQHANMLKQIDNVDDISNLIDGYSNMSSVYGKNSGLEILTCADIKDMTGIKIPSHNDTWWCILEFSCQEVRECSDDLVIFFASSAEMQRFLRLLEQLWQAKNNDLFPITVLDEDDMIAEQCTMLYMDINRSWEPLLSAALGYPL